MLLLVWAQCGQAIRPTGQISSARNRHRRYSTFGRNMAEWHEFQHRFCGHPTPESYYEEHNPRPTLRYA
jgi:hypothetical protein